MYLDTIIVSILFFISGIFIYGGKTELIHNYHQTRVKDKQEYGKAFGKTLFGEGICVFLSAAISMIAQSDNGVIASIILFLTSLTVFLVILSKIQKKYNGGVF